jgi:hypothetical protein
MIPSPRLVGRAFPAGAIRNKSSAAVRTPVTRHMHAYAQHFLWREIDEVIEEERFGFLRPSHPLPSL